MGFRFLEVLLFGLCLLISLWLLAVAGGLSICLVLWVVA